MTEEVKTILEFSEDVSTAEAPAPLPPGEYPAEIRDAKVVPNKAGTGEYVQVSFYIRPEDYPADYPAENAPDGKTLVYRRLNVEDGAAARYRIRKFCEAIGAPASRAIDITQWLGAQAKLRLTHDTYNGEKREQIAEVKSVA